MRSLTPFLAAVLAAAATLGTSSVRAEEGMWLFNDFPATQVKAKYGFEPDQKWLDHVRLSSVRLAEGCSGSIVSPEGLVMTNHHCAHSCIEQLSTAKKDFVASGFLAKTPAEEVKCPEIEINQLMAIADVTERVNAATRGLADQQYNEALKAEMSKIEKECATGEDRRCDVVTLYRGGQYHLYTYRRFQDVRLAFAPEFATAFFGGDPDNFEFPRYDLDVSFLRIYEGGKPAKTPDFLPFATSGPKDGDLVFVSGQPGGTNRLTPLAQLEVERDVTLPRRLLFSSELKGLLTRFQTESVEKKRISNALLFHVENGIKA
ncbi:MAG: S46 family peptidase, partial [Deltaproteobacteria bacterium]|nr:S46 family peptidase [Deltaproteobacteria bacterium]